MHELIEAQKDEFIIKPAIYMELRRLGQQIHEVSLFFFEKLKLGGVTSPDEKFDFEGGKARSETTAEAESPPRDPTCGQVQSPQGKKK